MEQEKKRSPYQMLWEWARAYHGSFYAAVIFGELVFVSIRKPKFFPPGKKKVF